MDILHALGCAVCAALAATVAVPACTSVGFTGIAALAGGLLVMSLVGGEA